MSKVQIELIDGEQVYNEFKHYVDCRYLSAMASYWRLASFTIDYNDHTIYRLAVHLENYQNVIVDEWNLEECLDRSGSEQLAYFQLNQDDPEARQYLYCDIPYHYKYDKQTKVGWNGREQISH